MDNVTDFSSLLSLPAPPLLLLSPPPAPPLLLLLSSPFFLKRWLLSWAIAKWNKSDEKSVLSLIEWACVGKWKKSGKRCRFLSTWTATLITQNQIYQSPIIIRFLVYCNLVQGRMLLWPFSRPFTTITIQISQPSPKSDIVATMFKVFNPIQPESLNRFCMKYF